MDKESYRPRLLIILAIAIVIGQAFSINYLKNDFEKKIGQCYEAINTYSVLQGALVNILVEKKVLERNDLLNEAQALSKDLMAMMEKMDTMKTSDKEIQKTDDSK